MLNLGLFQKLSLLVCVPLLFEFVFVSILVGLQQQAEFQAARLANSKEVVFRLSEVSRKVYQFGVGQFMPELSVDEGLTASVASDVEILKRLTKGRPAEQKAVQRIEGLCKDAGELTLELMDAGSAPPVRLVINRQLSVALNQLVREIFYLTDLEEGTQRIAPLEEQKGRQRVVQWLVAGLIASTILAVALLVLLHRNFVSRLENVMENTRRFLRQEALLPRERGADEIATLDNVFHDMTEQIEKSAAKERAAVEARQHIMQMIAHDLRSPLTSLMLFMDLLKGGNFGEVSQIAHTKLTAAGRDLKRMVHLVGNFLDQEKLEAGRMQLEYNTISLEGIVDQAVSSVSALAEAEGISVELSVESGMIYVDSDKLIQVLVNLLSNAINVSQKGQVVTVSATIKNNAVEFCVLDRGPGVPEGMRDGLFERFSKSSKKEGSGSGLGLSLAKEIVQMHKGTLEFKDRDGGGTVFQFTVPCE
ncbi:MAG: GHKL domain-containing protein [Candidatus Obscuribacterales bacterium]|nr:GHKL domain-containing protein [Candidatus Obscuribacterales bacterium]